MTRIISGRYRGHRLRTPRGQATRPTTDRVREAMFTTLGSMLGGQWSGIRVLDLFAGSGALGLEAVSRGADSADLVDNAPKAAESIRANLTSLGVASVRFHRRAASAFLADTDQVWDVVLIDPPYELPASSLDALLDSLRARLGNDPIVMIERRLDTEFVWPAPYSPLRDKTYGTTRLWYGR